MLLPWRWPIWGRNVLPK